MKFVVDELPTSCENCPFVSNDFSSRKNICDILHTYVVGSTMDLDKCKNYFVTFEEMLNNYSEKDNEIDYDKLLETVSDNNKQNTDSKISPKEFSDLMDGFLGKVKPNEYDINKEEPDISNIKEKHVIENSSPEEKKLKTIGEELRSYKNLYYQNKN